MLQVYVSSVSDVSRVRCKYFIWMLQSRSRCCICCNGYTRMLQAYVPNVSSVFRRMLLFQIFLAFTSVFKRMLHAT
uniref:Uncharacterized protein n=1 Tax=Setaria viridis TaxID=4556 RepID=A0A4U6TI52_SETVI|nr:hypothetical protein SEVIR_8G096901v2 [Setaria viridis]